MNDGMWGIWVFAALGVFLWIDHQRCSRERRQAKVDLAEKLRAYMAMSDKQRAEYLEELSANIEEDEREERRILDALRTKYRDRSGGVWRRSFPVPANYGMGLSSRGDGAMWSLPVRIR